MLKGFKDFIFRGNVVELAVAVIIGGAFGAVVTSLVKDVFTPLIGAVVGNPDFSAIKAGPVNIGLFINALIAFLLVAVAVYFLIVVPMKKYQEMKKKEPAPAVPPEPSEEVKLLREIRDSLRK